MHACDWQEYARYLEEKLSGQAGQMEVRAAETDELKEKLAAMARKQEREARKQKREARKQKREARKQKREARKQKREARKQERDDDRSAQKAEALRKRRENEIAKTKLETIEIDIPVPQDQCTWPSCGKEQLKPVGWGKESTIIDYVSGHFRRRVYKRETLKCSCEKYIVTAPPPEKASEGSR
jgi:hypothetical protein